VTLSSRPLLRSLLFVPGDSERKQARALTTAADALILDLEDSVAPAQLAAARVRVRELLQAHRDRTGQQLWVRVNSPASGALLDDLAAVFPGAPDGLVLPKISSPAELSPVAQHLTALEAREGVGMGSTRLIVIGTETPRGLLELPGYSQALAAPVRQRLVGLTWGMEDLVAALGASARTDTAGALTFTFQLARSMCLLTAAALEIQAIDGIHVDFRDSAGLARETDNARRDGFTGKLAIHPDQIATINGAFAPTEAEIARARRIVAAFAAAPDAGVISINGEMIDRPHLVQARRILSRVAQQEA
jgi:citrate lyase subunit beta/citryl-CoA lyase